MLFGLVIRELVLDFFVTYFFATFEGQLREQ